MKTRFILIPTLFFLLFVGADRTIIVPENDHVSGELIVMMSKDVKDAGHQAMKGFVSDFKESGLEPLQQLSRRMNIWLFEFSPDKSDEGLLLADVKKHHSVIEAQFNHFVTLRETFPDDTQFPAQWNMHNTGQSGGVEDADIDAVEAWDYTTGGYTALGDTIVIAIVDDGFDLNHFDIDFWKNRHDIPGNNIDDDNNGYVDDYNGWNAYTNTGTLIARDHGTHVSGIAGAIGNNDMGVAGVNWGAKILPVCGSSTTESIVVTAYSYVYEIRATYEETNGQQGAFIISTNASFGVNQGQPEDYPVWGAMYDSLGQLGILSAGATANAGWNIDEVGDIPTAFESDYMISVTNTTDTDVKNNGAAYGLVTIDLGAPGTSIMSTKNGNFYGYKTGTSMSSPHVAGAVALLCAAATESFMDAYNQYPGILSLSFKDYIMHSVDVLPTLDGVTVSGGRLNLHQAIELMYTPVLTSDIEQITIDIEQNTTSNLTMNVSNTGVASINYDVLKSAPVLWLSMNPAEGILLSGGSIDIQVSINASGVSVGVHSVDILLTGGTGEETIIPVTINVTPYTGIDDKDDFVSSFNIYPNPSSEILNIKYQIFNIEYLTIKLFDATGKEVKEIVNEQQGPGEYLISCDVADLPSGTYYCKISKGSVQSGKKIIIN